MESLSSPHRTRKTVWVSIAAPEIEHADCLCSRHISVLRSGCPSRCLQRVCGQPLLQTFRSLVTNVKARYLSRISILSVIGIRLAFVHQFMSCRVLELSIKSYVRSSLGRRNLSHVTIHISHNSLSVFGSVGCWKALRLELRNCYAITIFTGGFCLEDGGV